MDTNNRGRGISFVLVLIFVGFLVYFAIRSGKEKVTTIGDKLSDQKEEEALVSDIGKCGLIVSSPAPGSVVAFPLDIKTVVDNTNMKANGCAWTAFEAQAGTVKVMDSNNTQVGFGILSTNEDWMTAGPVHYTSKITLSQTPASKNLTLVFEEENPSGEGTPDTFVLPIKIQ